ncbi:MAG: gamma-butyrobetaine hydroxylase-like domain-containing protein, partial [Ilumatobacteraceae bacterium]
MEASFREIEMGPTGGRLPAGAVSAAHKIGADVLVQFTEGSATLLPDWLRDNCQCTACRIVQTDERRWQPWSSPSAPVVDTVEVVDGELRIGWVGGHRSAYGPPEWQKIRTTGARGAWTARLWDGTYEVERFDHQQCIADEVTRRGMFEAIRRDGA